MHIFIFYRYILIEAFVLCLMNNFVWMLQNFIFNSTLIYFQSGRSILEYQNQAKMLFRKLGPQSPTRCSIETGPYLFQ